MGRIVRTIGEGAEAAAALAYEGPAITAITLIKMKSYCLYSVDFACCCVLLLIVTSLGKGEQKRLGKVKVPKRAIAAERLRFTLRVCLPGVTNTSSTSKPTTRPRKGPSFFPYDSITGPHHRSSFVFSVNLLYGERQSVMSYDPGYNTMIYTTVTSTTYPRLIRC